MIRFGKSVKVFRMLETGGKGRGDEGAEGRKGRRGMGKSEGEKEMYIPFFHQRRIF